MRKLFPILMVLGMAFVANSSDKTCTFTSEEFEGVRLEVSYQGEKAVVVLLDDQGFMSQETCAVEGSKEEPVIMCVERDQVGKIVTEIEIRKGATSGTLTQKTYEGENLQGAEPFYLSCQ